MQRHIKVCCAQLQVHLPTLMLTAINNFLNANSKAESPYLNEDAFGAFSIDEYRPMRVAVIGAGASGILAGIRSVV